MNIHIIAKDKALMHMRWNIKIVFSTSLKIWETQIKVRKITENI